MTVPTRPLGACILINAPGWRFWLRRFLARRQLRKIRGLPPARRLGVNPTRMDLRGSKLFDPAAAAAFSRRQKLRGMLCPRRARFCDRCDALFDLHDDKKLVADRRTLGRLGCALSHIEAWRAAAELPDDTLCLIIEDDALVTDHFDAAHVPWPPDADIVNLFSHGVRYYTNYSAELVRCVPYHVEGKPFTHGTLGYCLSGASARRLLAALTPLHLEDIHNFDIDLTMWRSPRINTCAPRSGWVRHPAYRNSSILPRAGLFVWVKRWAVFALCCAAPRLPRAWLRFLTARFPPLRYELTPDRSLPAHPPTTTPQPPAPPSGS